MKYDFDKIIDRRNIDSVKWDVKEGELPMWVADMDFAVCPHILDYLKTRMTNPTFGYNIIPEDWYNAYINWWQQRHDFLIDKNWLMFSQGVVPSISSIVRRLTLPGEKVVVQTPVYNIFFNSIVNNGRVILESPLVYENHQYAIDFCDLEAKLSDPQVSLMILCNPHNPVGKLWDKETLQKIGEIAYKHNVIVLSDEIHCDITMPGKKYVPFLSASDICKNNGIACVAPSKAFNIAGLHTSAIIVPNRSIRHKIWRGINNDEIAEPNSFAVGAAVSAFNFGGDWIDEFNQYVYQNRVLASKFIFENIPEIKLIDSEATYLLWIDCSNVCKDSEKFTNFLRDTTGLFVCDGKKYGNTGDGFIRANIACPKSVVLDGLNRLKNGVKLFVDSNK